MKREQNFCKGRIFGRYFDFAERQPSELALAWLGRPNGAMQGATPQDNVAVPAGFTFFGQFIDHDITLMTEAPSIGQPHNLARLRNMREPALNLDSVYGAGPGPDSPSAHFYDDDFRFRIAAHGFDLARDPNGVAIIGDGRNDENHLVSQLHLAFLRLHNKLMEDAGLPGTRAKFEAVRKIVVQHYQHYVLQEYVALHTPQDVLQQVTNNVYGLYDDLLTGSGGHLTMPIEFAGAAFRHGHSQVRGGYAINGTFGAVLFDPNSPIDLNGGRVRPPEQAVDWSLFFNDDRATPPNRFNHSQVVDGELAGPLFALRPPAIGDAPISLAERNLRRGRDLGLASGQSALANMQARGLAAQALSPEQLRLPDVLSEPFVVQPPNSEEEHADARQHTPLWFYLLREAEVNRQALIDAGTQPLEIPAMGPLGGALIAETLVGLLRRDTAKPSGTMQGVPSILANGFAPMAEIATLAKMTALASPNPT